MASSCNAASRQAGPGSVGCCRLGARLEGRLALPRVGASRRSEPIRRCTHARSELPPGLAVTIIWAASWIVSALACGGDIDSTDRRHLLQDG